MSVQDPLEPGVLSDTDRESRRQYLLSQQPLVSAAWVAAGNAQDAINRELAYLAASEGDDVQGGIADALVPNTDALLGVVPTVLQDSSTAVQASTSARQVFISNRTQVTTGGDTPPVQLEAPVNLTEQLVKDRIKQYEETEAKLGIQLEALSAQLQEGQANRLGLRHRIGELTFLLELMSKPEEAPVETPTETPQPEVAPVPEPSAAPEPA